MAGAIKISDSLISRDKTVNGRKICEVHYHEEHELYYMQEGRTTYFIDDEIYGVEKGEFVFLIGRSGVGKSLDRQWGL